MGFLSKLSHRPSAPVTIDAMLGDQRHRYEMAGMNYDTWGLSPNEVTSYGSDGGTTPAGNPFFTPGHQPGNSDYHTGQVKKPFLWSGKNRSLQTAFRNAYDQYWSGQTSGSANASWGGPQIRPLYDSSNALSIDNPMMANLGNTNYWQDNDHNKVFNRPVDDSLNGYLTGAENGNAQQQGNGGGQQQSPHQQDTLPPGQGNTPYNSNNNFVARGFLGILRQAVDQVTGVAGQLAGQ